MSIDIRYLTNGTKSVVVVRNAGVTPTSYEYYNSPEEVPEHIRHYCPKKVSYVGPDSARMFRAIDILYPNFPECNHRDYPGKICIAESCRYADNGDYTKCPYFGEKYEV